MQTFKQDIIVTIDDKRKSLRMRKEHLAEKSGITTMTYSRYLRGETFPALNILQDMCDAVNLTLIAVSL